MSDSRRCSSADSENMREKNYQIFSRQGAAVSKIFRDTSTTSMSKAILIFHFELHILPKVSKTVVILAKIPKNVFWVKIWAQRSKFADWREINRAKTWIGASVAEPFWRCALPRINFCNFFTHIFRISAATSLRTTHYPNLLTGPLKWIWVKSLF